MGIISPELDTKIATVTLMFAMEHEVPPKVVHDYARLLCDVDTRSMELLALISGVYMPSNADNDAYKAFMEAPWTAPEPDPNSPPFSGTPYNSRARNLAVLHAQRLWHRLKKARLVR